MVVTVGAINKKDVNNLYKDSEKTGGEKPIDLIKATRPIVIVDEPQSVDGGLSGAGKAALDAMNPLCTLRYSATHANKHHMVYRLDAVDAYERKLVKQIEVAAATIEDAFNKPYVRLLEVSNKKGISAKVELHVQTATGAKPQVLTVHDGDDLQQLAKRAVYADFRVGEISTAKGEEFMELRYPGGEVYLALGQAHGEVDALAVQREMIRRTIKEHLEKEKLLRPKGIKVLSLFFIESVARYRQYDKDGNPVKGDYARIFEEEYRRAAKLPAFQSLFGEVDLAQEAAAVHDGYFSIDKKGRWADPELDKEGGLKNETSRADAERGYNLIMKEKEKLLTFSTPLKFIFSHSALKEGWDNPNVFQICALREMGSERERRQTLGRGLRLVRQPGRAARLRARREPADGDSHRVVPGVRRPVAEGDRGRHGHPLRHRRAAPVRHHRHHDARRQGGPAGRGPVQGPVGPPARCRTHRRQGEGAGHAEDRTEGRQAGPAGRLRALPGPGGRAAAQGDRPR
jgi:type III restriction enzyme